MVNTAEEISPLPQPITWKEVLAGEREEPYFVDLLHFIEQERTSGKIIYPPNNEIFNALSYTPFEEIKVVLIGQDPYHGPHQAHGLCFSVRLGIPPPPSLVNIFKEMTDDLHVPMPSHGSLEGWAKQGVLLLNTVLTVEAGKPESHKGRGWERFTDRIIREVSTRRSGIVFLLWGSHAQSKGANIDPKRHCVLKAPHPSPLSAYRGFFGSKHFSRANTYLKEHGIPEIRWESLP